MYLPSGLLKSPGLLAVFFFFLSLHGQKSLKADVPFPPLFEEVKSGATAPNSDGFWENKGQFQTLEHQPAPEIAFGMEAGNISIFLLKAGGIAWQFNRRHYPDGYEELRQKVEMHEASREKLDEMEAQITLETFRMDMHLVGANEHAEVIKSGESDDYANFYAFDALQVRRYQSVIYQDIYPGIDWKVYGTKAGIKYDFIVHPGADPGQIKMRYSHQEDLFIGPSGNKIQTCSLGKIEENPPVTWQEDGTPIDSRFVLSGDTISYALGAWDKSQDLIIDPSILWSTYYGGTSYEDARGCVADHSGNVYIAGRAPSFTGIAMGGHLNTISGGVYAYLAKFNSNGVRLWATYYGGPDGLDEAFGCAVDADNNVFLSGRTYSNTGIAYLGHQNTKDSLLDAFLVKFDSTGTRLWGTYYGGAHEDWGFECATDSFGNVFMCGQTGSDTGIAFMGHQNTQGDTLDAFLVKFSPGGQRIWGTYYGGAGHDKGLCVSVDDSNNVVMGGMTISSTGIAYNGFKNTFGGYNDGYLVKFDNNGSRKWATYYGCTAETQILSCATQNDGGILIGGVTGCPTGISQNGYQNIIAGTVDGFVAKFNPDGTRAWGTYYGGAGVESIDFVGVDGLGNWYVSGGTNSTSGISQNGHQNTLAGSRDGFSAGFTGNGTRLFGTYHGTSGFDIGTHGAVGYRGEFYATGISYSSGIYVLNPHQPVFGGGSDGYLYRYGGCVPTFHRDTVIACNTYFWPQTGQVYAASGTYSDTLSNAGGCDSIISLNLTINNSSMTSGSIAACNAFFWPQTGQTYVASGTYSDTLMTTGGCDSIISLMLTINLVDTTVSQSGDTLSANATGATYQWLYCDSGFASVPGASNMTFLPDSTGGYAVAVTQNGCTDTSGCHHVILLRIGESLFPDMRIYPNPTNGKITITFEAPQKEVRISLYNATGQCLKKDIWHNQRVSKMEIPGPSGIYFLEIRLNEGLPKRVKVVKN